jgi:hypothetical protein
MDNFLAAIREKGAKMRIKIWHHCGAFCQLDYWRSALFAWLISHQPAVFFSHNKPAISNQPAVLFSQNKPAPAISHQPTEHAAGSSSSDDHEGK